MVSGEWDDGWDSIRFDSKWRRRRRRRMVGNLVLLRRWFRVDREAFAFPVLFIVSFHSISMVRAPAAALPEALRSPLSTTAFD